MIKEARDIIIRPIITEKSMAAAAEKKFTFEVAKTAGKIEIAAAIKEIFADKNIKVEKVTTMNCKGRKKRVGRFEGYTSDWKKAIVKLSDDSDTIPFFEGLA